MPWEFQESPVVMWVVTVKGYRVWSMEWKVSVGFGLVIELGLGGLLELLCVPFRAYCEFGGGCYIHGKLCIYMYSYLVSSMSQLVQSFPLAGFWCWLSFGEFEGPVGSINVNRHSPDYLLSIVNQYSHLLSSELLYTVLLSLLSLTSIQY